VVDWKARAAFPPTSTSRRRWGFRRGRVTFLRGNHPRLVISAPRAWFRPKLGHYVPLIHWNEWREIHLTQTTRDHELTGA
jgi:hypothetical protein